MVWKGIIYDGTPLLNPSGNPAVYDADANPSGPPEECCCTGCEFCPCCTRCPSISSSIDIWIEDQVQNPAYDGVCVCPDFTTTPTTAAFDDCFLELFFDITCNNNLTFEVLQEDGVCYMRAIMSGDSTSSGGGGLWSVTWEKNLGAGPIECSDLHELTYVSSTGGANVPCDFTNSKVMADILIP